MSLEPLCIRTFGEVFRNRMKKKSQIKNFDSEKKLFQSDAEVAKNVLVDLSNVFDFYKLLLDAVIYTAIGEDEDKIPDINPTMTTQLKNGKWEVNDKIKEIAQQEHTKIVVSDYFEANLIPNIPSSVRTSVLEDVDSLVRNSSDIKGEKRNKLKQAYRQRKNDGTYLAEVYLLAICNGTNRITNDESTTTSNNKQTKDSLNVNNELEASIANLPDPKQKTPPNQLLKEEQHSIRELYAADVTTETGPRFCFSISFADESIIELDVTSEKGAVKVFDTNYTDCIADEFSTETKNQIMKWFVSGKNGAFIVVLNDRRIDSVKPQYADLEAKIDAGVELTMEEQVRYSNLGQLIKRFDHERRIKEKAITFYLKDKLFHAYSQAGFYTYLLDFIKDILNFRQGISQDAEYRNIFTSFDVYTKTVPKEYFVVDLLKSDVEEALKKDPLLQFAGSFVCDWGIDMAKKIAVQYYVQYIGRQIIDHERPILESNEYLNFSKASIHNWLTGPH